MISTCARVINPPAEAPAFALQGFLEANKRGYTSRSERTSLELNLDHAIACGQQLQAVTDLEQAGINVVRRLNDSYLGQNRRPRKVQHTW